jgi:hypothetical protein
LEICSIHFHFDQNKLHEEGLKKRTQTSDGLLHHKRCLFCGINKYFYSRGKICTQHSWNLLGRNLQVPCIGQTYCPALKKQNYFSIIHPTNNSSQLRYICCNCFEKNGGHLHCRPGKGKSIKTCQETGLHNEDTTLALKILGQLILNIAESDKTNTKTNLLNYLNPILQVFMDNNSLSILSKISSTSTSTSSTSTSNTLSLFVIKTALKLKNNNNNNKISKNLTSKDCIDFGNTLADNVWMSKVYFKKNKENLENPKTLKQYINALPKHLTIFFDTLIHNLMVKRHAIASRKAKQEQ